MSSYSTSSVNTQNYKPLSLQELEQRDRFVHRHIGPSENDISEMLKSLGMNSLDELINRTVPDSIRMSGELDLPRSRSETEVLNELRSMANRNQVAKSMIGMGYHSTILPGVIPVSYTHLRAHET